MPSRFGNHHSRQFAPSGGMFGRCYLKDCGFCKCNRVYSHRRVPSRLLFGRLLHTNEKRSLAFSHTSKGCPYVCAGLQRVSRCIVQLSPSHASDRQHGRIEHVTYGGSSTIASAAIAMSSGDIIGSWSEGRVLAALHSTSTFPDAAPPLRCHTPCLRAPSTS